MACKIPLVILVCLFAMVTTRSYGEDTVFINAHRISYSPVVFNFVGAEKIQAVVEMANVLAEKQNIIDVSSALTAGRVNVALSDQGNQELSFSFDNTDKEVDLDGKDDSNSVEMDYATAIFGQVTAALVAFGVENPEIKDMDSRVVGLSVDKLSDVEEEVVVYCANGFVQYLIDLSSGEKGVYKEARVVKYETTDGFVVRFNKSSRIEFVASCRYPIAPTGRLSRGSVKTTNESPEKILVDSSFAPEFIVSSVVSFQDNTSHLVKLSKDVPYSNIRAH